MLKMVPCDLNDNSLELENVVTHTSDRNIILTKTTSENERSNSILMTRHYPDMSCASDWMKQKFNQKEAS